VPVLTAEVNNLSSVVNAKRAGIAHLIAHRPPAEKYMRDTKGKLEHPTGLRSYTASPILALKPMIAVTLFLGLLLLACATAAPSPQTGPIACVPNDAGKLVCFRR
jgi:hypothetical protein